MQNKFYIIAIGTWFLLMFVAIINAVLREGVYSLYLYELRAHQLSTITLVILIIILTFFVLKFCKIQLTTNELLIMGSIWVLLTIMFEFIAGHYIFGNPWDKLTADYNILKGRIWILIPLTTFVAPYLTKKLPL